MSESKHTQGDWEVYLGDSPAHYVLVNAYEYFEDGYLSDDPQTVIALRQEDEANRRLIESAPELLACVRWACAWANGWRPTKEQKQDFHRQCLTVIARVEGE